jgi:flagellar biosynthesis/type III secretory pathway chaperone
MPTKELLALKEVLSEERKALLSCAVDEVLKWASYKARLVESLKGKDLSEEDKVLLLEILQENERNGRIIQAGLSFVEEAYRFLQKFFVEGETYPQGLAKGKESSPKVLSKRA